MGYFGPLDYVKTDIAVVRSGRARGDSFFTQHPQEDQAVQEGESLTPDSNPHPITEKQYILRIMAIHISMRIL